MTTYSIRALWTRRYLLNIAPFRCICRNSSKWIEPTGHLSGISVYNTATKCKVPFILRNKNYASWYMCGPTVYDSAHIGHACCYVKFDIIRRVLVNFFDVNVVLVMGITDIDDKIIKRAYALKEDVKVISNKYEYEFFKDMYSLNVLPPDVTVRVTEMIPSIIEFVQNILSKGLAYRTEDGSVYFDTTRHQDYGKLCPVIHEDFESDSSLKKSVNDFALWKASKPDEPWWPSPWGQGRPGWHIECSAIASDIFGSTIDLHSGGIDLLFPHHENEEAQSCVYHNVNQWVNYWLHSGHLHLKGDEKMSKSLKNAISVHELLSSNSADHFRMYCLLSHYRNNVEYTDKSLAYAKSVYRKIESFLSECDAYIRGFQRECQVQELEVLEKLELTRHNFQAALADDFDTAGALGILLSFISDLNTMLHTSPVGLCTNSRSSGVIAAVSSFVLEMTGKLGLQFSVKETISCEEVDASKILDLVVNFRCEVRELTLKNLKLKKAVADNVSSIKLLKACDDLRDGLNAIGIEIKDHGEKSSWNTKHES